MDNAKKPAIAGNTDTGLLKIVAFITMLTDHAGYLFFPEALWLRAVGRIAFPIFCYCLVFGFFHTRNVKKYMLRVLIFAVVSQPFYTLAFYPETLPVLFDPIYYHSPGVVWGIFKDVLRLNVGFELLLGLLAIDGLENKNYFLASIAVALSLFQTFEYDIYGMLLILVIYFTLRRSKAVFGLALGGFLLLGFISGFGGSWIEGFAILALPLLLFDTHSKIRIPRLINYVFYPVHIMLLYFLTLFLK